MDEEQNKGTFDRLVSGLSEEDRVSMLDHINHNNSQTIEFNKSDDTRDDATTSLHVKFANESIFYKFFLWLRSLLQQKTAEQLYNDDIIAALAKRLNKNHPGIVNHRIKCLDSFYYDRLKAIKDAADFFKPYLINFEAEPGEFYVFLCSFVSPDITDEINAQADPFVNPFSKEASQEVKSELLRKLDVALNDMDSTSKARLYGAISSVNWLLQFSKLPFLHFSAQFTNLADTNYTCPYRNAKTDYDAFGAVFADVKEISDETLQALFLFTAKKGLSDNVQDKDIDRAVKEFLAKANANLALIQMYDSCVPVTNLGKIINGNYDWEPGNIPGAEAWFAGFRGQWRSIIESRWKEWIRERKKSMLADSLKNDFGIDEFPVMLYRPWERMFITIPFARELTGGFLSWFVLEEYDECIGYMKDVMLEGIFLRSENRTEYSESFEVFNQSMKDMQDLLDLLSPEGEFGIKFQEINDSRLRSLQNQNAIDSMMETVENKISNIMTDFRESVGKILLIYHGFFDDDRDGIHETLQNWMNIKGHDNRIWREKLSDVRNILKKSLFYIEELDPIDSENYY